MKKIYLCPLPLLGSIFLSIFLSDSMAYANKQRAHAKNEDMNVCASSTRLLMY